MGYVTVLVQHAWALQPTPQADSQSARVKCEKRETTNVGSNRRLNRPFDIEYINNLLTKLRVDPSETTVKRAWTAYASLEKVLRSDLSSKCNTANVTRDTVLTSLRKSSRRSMLALAHCPIIPLRCRALRCLLYELNDVRVASNICDVSALAELVKQWFSLQATVDDNDVGFDTEQQRQILMILSLLLEQLEYALSNRSKVIVPISEEFRSLLETHLVGNTWVHAAHDDLYLRNLSCIIQDTIENILSSNNDSSPAISIAISYLCKTIRGASRGVVSDLAQVFSMILRTSAGGCSRHSRRRILRILATAASFDESSLKVYFDTLIAVQDFEERENVYLGVLYIAPIIVNARGTAVSRIAMEQLIRYLSDDPTINKGHAPTDSLAAAAAMALIDVGNQCRNSALGLLADSALREHLNGSLSLQPYRGNLMRQRLNTFQDLKYCPYVSYIFQPISIGLAESYAENHSQMDALRQYLRTAERQHTEYGKMRYDDQSRELQFAKQSETIRLKIAPYHRNYREIQNVPSSPVNLAPSFMNGPPFTLAVPYPSSSGYASRRKLHHILPPRDRPSPEKSVKTACIRVELPTIAV